MGCHVLASASGQARDMPWSQKARTTSGVAQEAMLSAPGRG